MKKDQLQRTEFQECMDLVGYLVILSAKGFVVDYTHIPNETYTTSWNQKRKNTAMGVAKGFPDYLILGKKKMLFIEMKREKGGVVSPEQRVWLDNLSRYKNVYAVVCRGFNEAKEIVDDCFGVKGL